MLVRLRPDDRVLSGVAAGLAVLSVVCCVAAVVLHPKLLGDLDVRPLSWSDVVLGTVYPLAGAVIVHSRPRHAVGWVLVSAALMGPYLLAATVGGWSAVVRADPLPFTDVALWFGVWGFVPYFYVLPLVLLLFPDGRPATPRWRPVVIGLMAVATLAIATRMLTGIELDIVPQATNPVGVLGPPVQYVTLFGSFTVLFGGTALGLVSLRTRARRAVGAARAQLQWLSLGGLVLVVGLFGSAAVGDFDAVADLIFSIGLAGPPVAIAVAMVRHQLFDVEFALNRTIVFGVLSAIVVECLPGDRGRGRERRSVVHVRRGARRGRRGRRGIRTQHRAGGSRSLAVRAPARPVCRGRAGRAARRPGQRARRGPATSRSTRCARHSDSPMPPSRGRSS